ncbi:MAG: hypothetical protein EOP09_08495 [Proteobacteria bacterium]|nr:MAG: hypothetical protein EOP09_08495 [Pseudomonadota bacterium]
MNEMKFGTVAVVLANDGGAERWVDTFSDEREIARLEQAIRGGEEFPLEEVYTLREKQKKEDESFGDYVELLLSQPFVRPEVQSHGVAWMKSKIRIESFRRQEQEAAETIAEYALVQYWKNPDLADFTFAGRDTEVRVRIFKLEKIARGTLSA